MKKKIVHISHLYPTIKAPYLGSFMKELHDSLSDIYDATFIVPIPISIPFTKKYSIGNSPFLTKEKTIRTYYLSIPKRRAPKITRLSLVNSILPIIKNMNCDLIHVHWSYPEILIIPKLKKLGIPIVNTLHGQAFYETLNNKSLKPFLEKGLFHSDLTCTVGTRLKKDAIHEFPFLNDKCVSLPNGIDEEKFYIGDKKEARKKLDWDSDSKHILCVAHITKEKGLESLIEAFLALKSSTKVYLHIIGRPYDPALAHKILEISKKNNIIYHGALAHSELPLYYHASDMLVLPSLIEGFGVALVEAGMSGLPLLSTLSGGPEDIITPDTGLLVEPGNSTELNKKLDFLLLNLSRYSPLKIRKSMVSRFSRKKIALQLHNYYSNLL